MIPTTGCAGRAGHRGGHSAGRAGHRGGLTSRAGGLVVCRCPQRGRGAAHGSAVGRHSGSLQHERHCLKVVAVSTPPQVIR